jgi:two-component system, chemotaxis family, response regulator PixG
MNTINLGRQKFFQRKDHIAMLETISNNYIQGCLQVLTFSQSWYLYFEKKQLIYIYQANSMWDIFYEKLQKISPHLKNLDNELRGELKAIFDSSADSSIADRPDYLAICWLVEKQYVSPVEAGKLIEEIAIEVLDSFLKLRDGIYEFIPQSLPDYLPKFCHLDISLLARRCQLRSVNLTNISNVVEPFKDSEIGLVSLGYQELENKKMQFMSSLTSRNERFTHNIDIENNTVTANDKKKEKQTNKKVYKVLCIDDSPTILNAIRGFLDEEVFNVITVDNSLKALMQILHTKPDIILLDISMPNLDGYELCSLLRKHSVFQDTPVIMVTGRTGLIDKARAKMVKASGYLSKPFSKADLLKVVFSKISYASSV